MNNPLLNKGKESICHLQKILNSLSLIDSSLLKYHRKISIAKLLNKINIFGTLHDIIKSNNIFRFNAFHYFNF